MKTELSIPKENELSKLVIDICFKIHRHFGPGLFESAYEELFAYELSKHGIGFERQKAIPLVYESIKLNTGFRADFLIEQKLIVELKSVEALADIHKQQVLTYVKLLPVHLGLLINFNTVYLKDGIKRIINSY